MLRWSILLFALPLVVFACGNDAPEPYHLGPVSPRDAGTSDASDASDAMPSDAAPEPVGLTHEQCKGTSIVDPKEANALRSLATLESRAVLTLSEKVRAVKLNAEGCPGEGIDSFGTNGDVPIVATAAVPLPAGRVIVAQADQTRLLDSTGAEETSAKADGANLVAWSLQAADDGTVTAALSKSPIWQIPTASSQCNPSQCNASPVALTPQPFAIAHVATYWDKENSEQGFITVQLDKPSAPLVVALYRKNGNLKSTSDPAGSPTGALCSATGLVDTTKGFLVTDSTCRRVALFDKDRLVVTHQREYNDTPRGAALLPNGSSVLVAVITRLREGASVGFERVHLP